MTYSTYDDLESWFKYILEQIGSTITAQDIDLPDYGESWLDERLEVALANTDRWLDVQSSETNTTDFGFGNIDNRIKSYIFNGIPPQPWNQPFTDQETVNDGLGWVIDDRFTINNGLNVDLNSIAVGTTAQVFPQVGALAATREVDCRITIDVSGLSNGINYSALATAFGAQGGYVSIIIGDTATNQTTVGIFKNFAPVSTTVIAGLAQGVWLKSTISGSDLLLQTYTWDGVTWTEQNTIQFLDNSPPAVPIGPLFFIGNNAAPSPAVNEPLAVTLFEGTTTGTLT